MGREGVLVFSGKQITPSSEQTVSDIHITKECTLHFMQKKDSKLKLNITFQGITQVISIEKETNIKKLKQEGRSQFLRVDTPSYIINTKRIQLL